MLVLGRVELGVVTTCQDKGAPTIKRLQSPLLVILNLATVEAAWAGVVDTGLEIAAAWRCSTLSAWRRWRRRRSLEVQHPLSLEEEVEEEQDVEEEEEPHLSEEAVDPPGEPAGEHQPVAGTRLKISI